MRLWSSPSSVAPSNAVPQARSGTPLFLEDHDSVLSLNDATPGCHPPENDGSSRAASNTVQPATWHDAAALTKDRNRFSKRLTQAVTQQLRDILGVQGMRFRRVSAITMLEDDIVAQNFRRLRPIELVESGADLVHKRLPIDTHPLTALLGVLLFFIALAIASSPLLFTSMNAESVNDNSGLLVKKNASYANAYFLGKGFLTDFVKKMNDTKSAVNWFPQPTDTTFLDFSFMNPSAYSSYGTGACPLLNPDPNNPIDCILMTGHQGGVSSYGLCRNGTEYIAMHYITALVTPHDVAMPSGPWIENTREVIFTGLKNPPTCVDGKKIIVYPDVYDRRLMSGAFAASTRGVTDQWLDVLSLPRSVRDRMFYLSDKSGHNRLGLTLPAIKRQSFDEMIAQTTFGSTLADMLEIQSPFPDRKHVFVTVYRIAGAGITLPRLRFVLVVAAQSLILLIFVITLSIRNGPTRSYHLIVQILRLPTCGIISIELLYVLYYQIFSIAYLATNPSLQFVFAKKVVYVTGICCILMLQMDVRVAAPLWPHMGNSDACYPARFGWILAMVGGFVWFLNRPDPDHYLVTAQPSCPLAAMECNVAKTFFTQHWVCLAILISRPIAYSIARVVQWCASPSQVQPRAKRHPDFVTSFEAYACGRPLRQYYYYDTLVTKEINRADSQRNGQIRTFQYLTCGRAVRDEGFVLLGGCDVLVRVKDVYVFMLMKLVPRRAAARMNMSMVVAHIVNSRLTPMRRVSYEALWSVAHRWDGQLSYPDIG